jgi:hypothetical protein
MVMNLRAASPSFSRERLRHSNLGRPVETGRQGDGLAKAAILAGAGDQHPLTGDPSAQLRLEAKSIRMYCEGHKDSLRIADRAQ